MISSVSTLSCSSAAGSPPPPLALSPLPPPKVHGPLVLQLQRMKDISQPSAAQKDPLRIDTDGGGQRMLKLQLTDGKCHFSALEVDRLVELG